jgi:hypothetical protein
MSSRTLLSYHVHRRCYCTVVGVNRQYWQRLWYSFVWYDATSLDNWYPAFRGNVIVSSSMFQRLKMRPLHCLDSLGASYLHIILGGYLLSSVVYCVKFSRSKIWTCGFSNFLSFKHFLVSTLFSCLFYPCYQQKMLWTPTALIIFITGGKSISQRMFGFYCLNDACLLKSRFLCN